MYDAVIFSCEGFGLTVAEAMWKGTPVIGGNVGGIPNQDPESGEWLRTCTIITGEPDELVAQIYPVRLRRLRPFAKERPSEHQE